MPHFTFMVNYCKKSGWALKKTAQNQEISIMSDISNKNNQSILVIKLGALGDVMQAMGAFKAVRQAHIGAKITLLTTAPFKSIAQDCGYFDHIEIDPRAKWWNIPAHLKLRRFLRGTYAEGPAFDRVYDMQNNDRTKAYFKLMPSDTEWVGTAKGASHHDPASVEERRKGHIFDTLRKTLSYGGLNNIDVDPLYWMRGDLSALNLPEKTVIIVPGCAPTRPEKRWVTDRYIKLCDYIADQGHSPIIIGTDAEKDITSEIAKACTRTIDLTGKTKLYDIAELGRVSVAAIGNDTGPMHILGPVGCPLAVMYPGSSNAVRYKPLGQNVRTLQKEHMSDITIDDAIDLFDQLIADPKAL